MPRVGEALRPGPRQRKRGPRSEYAVMKRRDLHTALSMATSSEPAGPTLEVKEEPEKDAQVFQETELVLWHVNVQGLLSHAAELSACVRLARRKPHLLCLNETFLDVSLGSVPIEGVEEVERWDRKPGLRRGGVVVYAATSIAAQVTLVHKSEEAERLWLLVHSDHGGFLVGAWYRPPGKELRSIHSCKTEHDKLSKEAMGTILVGDINCHDKEWLKHSAKNSPEGRLLRQTAADMGLTQLVSQPTRGRYLVDLVLSDIPKVTTSVLPKIADHAVVESMLNLPFPEQVVVQREVWHFKSADCVRLRADLDLCTTDWSFLQTAEPNEGASELTKKILEATRGSIRKQTKREHKSTHPWLNDKVVEAVQAKRQASGSNEEAARASMCSAVVLAEYKSWCCRTQQELNEIQRGSKAWWAKERQLQLNKQKQCSTPALKDKQGQWNREAGSKAQLLADTFAGKSSLPDEETNRYSEKHDLDIKWRQNRMEKLSEDAAERVLSNLRVDSATGPDYLPARILKMCAAALAHPVYLLTMAILRDGIWPSMWGQHWVAPIYKRKSVYDANNYRGVHLTAQIAKVVERLLRVIFDEELMCEISIGPNQFAYRAGCGSRDAVAYLMLIWLKGFQEKCRFALYMSDVSGAFDRVSADRLIAKLRARQVPDDLLKVLASWLKARWAEVVVCGKRSLRYCLQNMVFQGTVLGPTLWNVFYGDSKASVNACDYTEIVFADDLNAFRKFSQGETDDELLLDVRKCQTELREWGRANRVLFDASKESMQILSRHRPSGEGFKLLGIDFVVWSHKRFK